MLTQCYEIPEFHKLNSIHTTNHLFRSEALRGAMQIKETTNHCCFAYSPSPCFFRGDNRAMGGVVPSHDAVAPQRREALRAVAQHLPTTEQHASIAWRAGGPGGDLITAGASPSKRLGRRQRTSCRTASVCWPSTGGAAGSCRGRPPAAGVTSAVAGPRLSATRRCAKARHAAGRGGGGGRAGKGGHPDGGVGEVEGAGNEADGAAGKVVRCRHHSACHHLPPHRTAPARHSSTPPPRLA